MRASGLGMTVWVEEASASNGFLPLTGTRPLADCLVANRTLRDWREQAVLEAGAQWAASREAATIWLDGSAWLDAEELRALDAAKKPAQLVDCLGAVVAWSGEAPRPGAADGGRHRIPARRSRLLRYSWELLNLQERILAGVAESRIEGELSDKATVEGVLILGRGSRVLPGVFIEGVVVVGENCRIGPNCYIRGYTAIGDRCRVGQAVEIKNSILYEDTWIGHLSYCGDSVIGAHVNFGAGTIASNFRHDGQEHRSMVDGILVATGRDKFGTVMGDGVHTGVHTSIYPGRKLWPGITTAPGAVVRVDLME